jgi:hypothetical protein
MSRPFYVALTCLSVLLLCEQTAYPDPPMSTPVYELRIYVCEPGKLDALNERFRNHTLKLFEKHGMENVAYWTPTDGEAAGNTLIYVLKHASREAADASWKAFRDDPEWQRVAAESQKKHGKILAQPPQSTFMKVTDYSPTKP